MEYPKVEGDSAPANGTYRNGMAEDGIEIFGRNRRSAEALEMWRCGALVQGETRLHRSYRLRENTRTRERNPRTTRERLQA